MEDCILGKMAILEGRCREEKDFSLDIFIQGKSALSGIEGSRGNKETVVGEERPALDVHVCGIYTLTHYILLCGCFPLLFLLFSVVLGLCSCACQVSNLAHFYLLRAQGIIPIPCTLGE